MISAEHARNLARQKMMAVFGPTALEGKQVHHIDGNPRNNDITNLEIVTPKEHGLRHRKVKTSGVIIRIRNIPVDVHAALKKRAIDEGMSMEGLVLQWVEAMLEKAEINDRVNLTVDEHNNK